MAKISASKIGCAVLLAAGFLLAFGIVILAVVRPGCSVADTPRTIAGQVIDENGHPVSDVEVKLVMSGFSYWHAVYLVTDANGQFSGTSNGWSSTLSVQKEGYYPTSLSIDEHMPSTSLPILLNKIRTPQPMVGKKVTLQLPIGASDLQYDFLAGDCLPPFGEGLSADLEIRWTRPARMTADGYRQALTSAIKGPGNGAILPPLTPPFPLIRSSLRSLHEAPLGGYQPSCDFGSNRRDEGLVAYFKIRTGQPGGPLFGKMLDPISYWAGPDSDRFEFEYVVNPSGGRSLEIDMKKIVVPHRKESEREPEEF